MSDECCGPDEPRKTGNVNLIWDRSVTLIRDHLGLDLRA